MKFEIIFEVFVAVHLFVWKSNAATINEINEVDSGGYDEEILASLDNGARQLWRPSIESVSNSLEATYINVRLVLINRQDITQTRGFSLAETSQIIPHNWYDQKLQTVIYCMGFNENLSSLTVQAIIKGYSTRTGYNIIIVDWSSYNSVAAGDFTNAINNMKSIGGLIGIRLSKYFGTFQIKKMHLVGHSLGAHMAAYINRGIPNSLLATKIPEIIGLDPLGPMMYDVALNHKPLTHHDAKIVQVIHTDMKGFGASEKSGSIDFYPNGGGVNGIQPGCPSVDAANPFATTNFCSHQRSVYLYAESLTTKEHDAFRSIACDNYVDFLFDDCYLIYNRMGIGAEKVPDGDFYLQTNSFSPFNRGPNGILYSFTAP